MKTVEFIESYRVHEDGGDYLWNDNHGRLIRCKDCIHSPAAHDDCPLPMQYIVSDGYCHLGEKKDD